MSNRLEISMDALELQENGSYRKRASQPITAKPVVAQGKLKPRKMNKTEARFETEFLKPRLHTHEILWYDFECWSFRIGDDCRYFPDFPAMLSDGEIVLFEVKGFMQDDALVKLKAVSERYPFKIKVVTAMPAKEGSGWAIKDI